MQSTGLRMIGDRDKEISIKYKFKVPSRLSDTLGQDVTNTRWKKIIKAIENKQVEEVIEEAKSIGEKTAISLPHPFKEDVNTYAIRNVRKGMCNFIFFIDDDLQHPWILCQCTSFIDAIFTEEYSAGHQLSPNSETITKSAKRIIKDKDNICFVKSRNKRIKFSGYILDQTRPYHHFYDQLKWLIHLETKKVITSHKSFFIPSHYKIKENTKPNYNSVSMFPLVIGSNQLGTKLDIYSDKMEKTVYEDSTKDLYSSNLLTKLKKQLNALKKIRNKNRTLTLWFGISGQKRIWIEQENFLPLLVQQLRPWFSTFVFIIDGFTQYENTSVDQSNTSKATPINQDMKIISSIRKNLLPYSNTTILSMVGKTYRKKIQQCESVDLFIANAGAGQLVPHRFCKKPGILHSNEKHCVFPMGINNVTVKLVDKSLVKDVGNLFATSKGKERSGAGLISYSIDSQVIINMVKEILKLNN